MDAILNAQVGMVFGLIAAGFIGYLILAGWLRRMDEKQPEPKVGASRDGNALGPGQGGGTAKAKSPGAAGGAERKKRQFQLQGKDAEIAAGVLRRMLSEHNNT